jgi:hypothetical protein
MTHPAVLKVVLLLAVAVVLVGLVACDAVTRVQGTVVDKDGDPIPGAVVRLTMLASGRTKQMNTGPDGKFDVELIHGAFAGRFDLVISKSGYVDHHQEVQGKTTQTLTIALANGQ